VPKRPFGTASHAPDLPQLKPFNPLRTSTLSISGSNRAFAIDANLLERKRSGRSVQGDPLDRSVVAHHRSSFHYRGKAQHLLEEREI
jgi:hypothetical protein